MFLLNTAKRIPAPDDFPTVFVILNATLDDAFVHLKEHNKDDEQVAEFGDWVADAKATGEDLVLYYY
jgi:hypothetical protein